MIRWAPRKTLGLQFGPGDEVRTMDMRYPISLVDRRRRVVEELATLRATTTYCAWSKDGRLVAVPIASNAEAVFVFDTRSRLFALVRLSGRSCVLRLTNESLRLICVPDELRFLNRRPAKPQVPVERFAAPAPVVIALAALRWHPVIEVARLPQKMRGTPFADMDARRDGYFPYSGSFPDSTVATIHGGPIEVHHLEAFAGIGDAQAQRWLAAVRRRARSASRWAPVSSFLGKRKRTLPAPR